VKRGAEGKIYVKSARDVNISIQGGEPSADGSLFGAKEIGQLDANANQREGEPSGAMRLTSQRRKGVEERFVVKTDGCKCQGN